MPSVNLAPGTQQIVAAQKRRRRLFLLTALILIAVGAAWGGLKFYQNQIEQQEAAVNDQIRTVQSEIARLASDAERVQLFEARLTSLGELLDKHLSWEPLLRDVERLLPPTVRLTHMVASVRSGELTVEGLTADIDQISQALASLLADSNQSVFSKGDLTSVARKVARTAEGVEQVDYAFQIVLTFDPTVLRK